MKLSSSFGSSGRFAARLRNAGSLLTRGHDDRPAALDDLADDALADAVADRVRRRVEAVRGLDVQLAVVVQQRDEAAHGAVVLGQNLEHPVQRRAQVQRARERLADFEQRGQPPRLARVGRRPDRRTSRL